MRRCSRCSEAVSRRCFSGSGEAGASVSVGSLALEQAASSRLSATPSALKRQATPPPRQTSVVRALFMAAQPALRDLDLLWRQRLDPRAAPLLDCAAPPNTLPRQLL